METIQKRKFKEKLSLGPWYNVSLKKLKIKKFNDFEVQVFS